MHLEDDLEHVGGQRVQPFFHPTTPSSCLAASRRLSKLYWHTSTRMVETVDLIHVLQHAERSRHHPVVFQKRPARYKFGVHNYGEFVGWRNAADGDCWDAFAPGYTRVLRIGVRYRVKRIIGVVKIANGNHKIAVELYVPGCDPERVEREAIAYASRYTSMTRREATWVRLPDGKNQLDDGIGSCRSNGFIDSTSKSPPSPPSQSSAGNSPNDSRPLQQL